MTVNRLPLWLVTLVAGMALLVGASGGLSADGAGEVRKGGTLRLATFQDVVHVDTALAYSPWTWPIQFATCAKLFNHADASGAAGATVIPEVVDRFTVSKDGRTYTFDLKRTFRFHTGAPVTAQSFADAFDRDRQSEAGVACDELHARDRRCRRGDRRQGDARSRGSVCSAATDSRSG